MQAECATCSKKWQMSFDFLQCIHHHPSRRGKNAKQTSVRKFFQSLDKYIHPKSPLKLCYLFILPVLGQQLATLSSSQDHKCHSPLSRYCWYQMHRYTADIQHAFSICPEDLFYYSVRSVLWRTGPLHCCSECCDMNQYSNSGVSIYKPLILFTRSKTRQSGSLTSQFVNNSWLLNEILDAIIVAVIGFFLFRFTHSRYL